MRVEPFLLAAALALGACGERPPRETAPPPPPAPAVTAAPEAEPLTPARYVGRWAATEELCGDGAWIFAERSLTTAGEVACGFDEVRPAQAGYDIAATCTAQAPAASYSLSLAFPESDRAMRVEGGPFGGPIELIACPAP